MGVIGVDGGNTKTDLVVATLEGEPVAYVRGPGSNSHAVGADGCARVIGALVERTGVETPVESGAFFLCGADVQDDIDELSAVVTRARWARASVVDNDTFALLRAGSERPNAVAVVCGSGFNCVGRNADGRVARYPSLGWETGDWGGGEPLGREALFFAARAEDGRGEPTALVELVRTHFALPSVADVGAAIHYRRVPHARLGELAPAIVALAARDSVARRLVERLADEVALAVRRAVRDLELEGHDVDVVLGGGVLAPGAGPLHDAVVSRIAELVPEGKPVVASGPPVLGAALAALDNAGATPAAGARLQAAFDAGVAPA